VLNKLAGTTIHTYPAGTDRQAKMELWAEQLRQAGETPYIIPLGGSNALGSQGYVDCAKEILSQTQQRVTHVVVASSSLGTQAGLLSGFLLQNREDIRVIGVDIEGVDVQATQQALRELVASSVQLNTGKAIHPSSINTPVVFQGYQGAGYGVETQVGLNAIQLCARTDGVLLDPVYSGKAMSALLAGSKGMGIDESSVVVFIHTGGAHSLYAYNTALTAKL
jgi:L-cysteate sulfo-lyase